MWMACAPGATPLTSYSISTPCDVAMKVAVPAGLPSRPIKCATARAFEAAEMAGQALANARATPITPKKIHFCIEPLEICWNFGLGHLQLYRVRQSLTLLSGQA